MERINMRGKYRDNDEHGNPQKFKPKNKIESCFEIQNVDYIISFKGRGTDIPLWLSFNNYEAEKVFRKEFGELYVF